MMRQTAWMTILIAALATATATVTAQAKLYRWVDEEGNVHYSDRVPPAAAQKERKVLDEQGRTVEQHQRAKTKEELEEERRRREQVIEEARKREERARQDRALLATFTTVEDLEHLRDDRVTAIDAQIAIVEEKLERLRRTLADLEARAESVTEGGKAMISDELNLRLQRTEQEIVRNEEYVKTRRAERQAVIDQFDADIVRFKELKADRVKR